MNWDLQLEQFCKTKQCIREAKAEPGSVLVRYGLIQTFILLVHDKISKQTWDLECWKSDGSEDSIEEKERCLQQEIRRNPLVR